MKRQFMINDYLSGLFLNIESIAIERIKPAVNRSMAFYLLESHYGPVKLHRVLLARQFLCPNIKIATSRIIRQD